MERTMQIIMLAILSNLIPIPASSVWNGTQEDLRKLDELLRKYDRRALPTSHLGKPTVVFCEIYIRSFGSINPATMDYEVDLYLRQSWNDTRLESPNVTRALDLNDPNLVKRIWKPEVFFPNAKNADFQYVTVPNVLVRLNPGGSILYMLRLRILISCMMDLYRFPLDSQICTIELASFSKTTDELNLQWAAHNPVVLFDFLKLPQFEIQDINTSLCKEKFHIGEYSCLRAEFNLQRSIGHHLVQSYLPTALIVVISWVSFWLDVESIPARITLGVTTLLTITSKGAGIQSNLPPVSYVKAMDVWMGACTSFVFAAVLEFTFVNYLWRKHPNRAKADTKSGNLISLKMMNGKDAATKDQSNPVHVGLPSTESNQHQFPIPDVNIHKIQAKRIDHYCRIAFPSFFLLFNIAYWPYYLR
ncbi:glycine receptor subunit alpha-2-like [Centruroides sculpturatus]|uniref:glycine receptor subunit alpha-2-like n=1 Tax=Centruroides sculpturatus TaxID=218467 RepID=UPI000C6DA3A5|nr:glycine receptor subunit alpha-2-like [Centruroides sculpturatus]